jgi:circadian clock protein KaiC
MTITMDPQRVSTGVSGLDSQLSGGFIKGRSYVILGDAGTGKTTACLQFLLSGLKQGEKGLYITVDERPAEIIDSAASLGWDFESYTQDKSLVMLDASPYFSGRAGAASDKGVDLQKIVSDLAGYGKRIDATRLVIDPITPMIFSDSSSRVQDQARSFIHLVHSQLNTTNLFSAQYSSRAPDPGFGIEEFLVSGVLHLKTTPVKGGFARKLTIKKMRGTPIQPSDYWFAIIAGEGIVLTQERERPTATQEAGDTTLLEYFEPPAKAR